MAPHVIRRMFEQDFSETQTNENHMSQEDRNFLRITSRGIHKTEDGHYEMPLPFREKTVNLPCNRRMAETRLVQLKKRFVRDPKYKKDYVTFVEQILENGHAEKAPKEHASAWYIPHHGVYHPKKPEKIRVVFDCSADFQGHSLNRHLLQGPDLTNSLVGVLCRFRKEPVAVACDIEGMFHQVRVNEEHRNFLRFLWWDKGDTTKEPEEYRMKVHLFGATSSPGCANLALRSAADDGEEMYGAEAATFVRKNFYVDDGLVSVPTIENAISLLKKGMELCKNGGFRLHKFTSNEREVIESIEEEDRAKNIKNLDIKTAQLPPERVLGIEWCIESDVFQFRITLKDRPVTRRGILSSVSSIYDPLGFAAPFLLRGKRILQLLCKEDIGWDEPIPEPMRNQWEKWRGELPLLEHMQIPRCFKPEKMGDIKKVELHHFSDASTEGYGQCSYIRFVDINDLVHCSLVIGKARVAPLKPITVPRLELTAALVSGKMSNRLNRELKYDRLEEFFWTDSKVVLGYINNEARRFHTYVANRVQQIRDYTEPKQWKYVDTKHNPADDASRGLSPKDLLKSSRWVCGPAFLWEPRDDWQDLDEELPPLQADDKEVKKSTALSTLAKEPSSYLLEIIYRFSDWFHAKQVLTNCLKFARLWRAKAGNEASNRIELKQAANPMTVADMCEIERLVIKAAQFQAFSEEIRRLKTNAKLFSEPESGVKNKEIKNTSPIYRLDPFIDEQGVLRVGGRIHAASISEEVKHPVILPREGHVSWLIAKAFHEATKHQGRGQTLNEIRASGYWIVGFSSMVSKLIHSCVTCRKLRAGTADQRMANLPKERLTPAPPFTYCAVDYFGPFHVKEGRKDLKRYGVLFTCLASRAIHLEVANSLETDSYINALRRFICRRGPVRQMRSDQGTNFVGAARELKEALHEMDQEKIQTEMLKMRCDWFTTKMNIPSASHMGGVWERQIRTVRNVLSALLVNNGTQLNDEALRTFFCEAEAVVNSRPLTSESLTSVDSVESLTPNHLLTAKSKVVLPPPGVFQEEDKYARKWWRRVQHLTNVFWCRWKREFLQTLQLRQKWIRPRRNLEEGDIVLVKDDNTARNNWRLARVISIIQDDDKLVRKVKIAIGNPKLSSKGKCNEPLTVLERPVHKLVLLTPADPKTRESPSRSQDHKFKV